MKGKKIVVTGATGIVGSHVAVEMLRRGGSVTALSRPASNRELLDELLDYYGLAECRERLFWRDAELTDEERLKEVFAGADYVVHAAAMVSFCKADHEQMWRVNVEGTEVVCRAVALSGVGKLCHVSSIGALGKSEVGPTTEKTAWQPDAQKSVYSRSKMRSEMEVWRAVEEHDIKAVVVNPGVVLGPGAIGRSSNQVTELMRKGSLFYADGTTGYVDARDLAYVIAELLRDDKSNAEGYVVVSHNCRVRDVQSLFCENFGKVKPRFKLPKWLMYAAACVMESVSRHPQLTRENVRAMGGTAEYSSEKLRGLVQYAPKNLNDSIRNMVEFSNRLKSGKKKV